MWQDADVSTPAKCKKILRDEGVAFAPDASHPRLALLAQTAVRKKRKLNFVTESDFAEEIKVSTSLSVSEFVDLVQKVITQKDEKGYYCVNVRCILNNITTPFTVLRCGRNKCPTTIKAGNSMCNKCYGAVNDAYTYTDFLFQLTLEAWDSSDKMDVTGVKKAGILYVPIRTLFFCCCSFWFACLKCHVHRLITHLCSLLLVGESLFGVQAKAIYDMSTSEQNKLRNTL